MFFFSTSNTFTYSAGSPSGFTGSPGDNLSTCVSCHAVNINESLISDSLSVNLFSDIGEYYIPGHLYNFTIVADADTFGIDKFGFQTCFENDSNQKVGDIIFTTDGKGNLFKTKIYQI